MADDEAEEDAVFDEASDEDEDWELLFAALRYVAAGDAAGGPRKKKRAKETRKRQGRFEHQYQKGTKEARVFNPKGSTWWSILQHPDLVHEETRMARRFRQKFRLPLALVKSIQRRVIADHPEWLPGLGEDAAARTRAWDRREAQAPPLLLPLAPLLRTSHPSIVPTLLRARRVVSKRSLARHRGGHRRQVITML